jgi:hypothetical protein
MGPEIFRPLQGVFCRIVPHRRQSLSAFFWVKMGLLRSILGLF